MLAFVLVLVLGVVGDDNTEAAARAGVPVGSLTVEDEDEITGWNTDEEDEDDRADIETEAAIVR